MKRLIITIILTIFVNFNYAQGQAALPFLSLQQSPLYLGAGSIGVTNPFNDYNSFYLNPAILGHSSKTNYSSVFITPVYKLNSWLIIPELSNYGFSAGYDLSNSKFNLPFTIGIGFLHHKFSFGTFKITGSSSPAPIGEYESYDAYNSFNVGIGFKYYLHINFGAALKKFESNLSSQPTIGSTEAKAEGIAFDYGFLVVAPITELLLKDLEYSFGNKFGIFPTSEFSLGFSVSNIGDEIYYVDPAQSDPLARNSRFGYSIKGGLALDLGRGILNLVDLSFSAEGEDLLVESNNTGNWSYQTPFTDMKFTDVLINNRGDENIIAHKASIISVCETFTFSSGSYMGSSLIQPVKSNGIAVSTKGIFKIIKGWSNSALLDFIFNNMEFTYYQSSFSTFQKDKYWDSDLTGFALSFVNIEL